MSSTPNCAHCGGGLGPGDSFCAQCGAELVSCRICGESLLPSDPTCPECGTPAESHRPPPDSLSFPLTDAQSSWTDMVDRLRRATLGEFDLGRELGRGGMAAVFLAHEISLDRKVAIKVMSPGLLLDDAMIDRFRHEAITIAHLHHPHIVSLYSVRQAEGLHFFVMQYVQGRSLDQIIRLAGRLPVPIVRSILAQVGSALTYAHRSRVVHRDIKPANILIDGDGNAVVTDFGIAKAARTPSQTLTGALVGTPAYMSPEQCRGSEVSGASDQYSLGAVGYEMLTGSPPFSGSTLTVMQAHVEQTPAPLRHLAGDCPAELEAAILRMLAKDPGDRWPRMTDALMALGAAALADEDPLRLELCRLAQAGDAAARAADETPTSPMPPTRPPAAAESGSGAVISSVSILPPPSGLEVGDSFVLVATVRGAQGVCLPSTAVTWSGDVSDVLRFASTGGEAVAVGPGTILLTATCRGARASLRVDVGLPLADELVIAPADHGVAVGDEIRLEAVARDKRGQLITRTVTWSSDDDATASVTAEGYLAGRAPGFARITAELDDARTTLSVPVLPARVAAIRVASRPATVATGEIFEVTATPVDRWGSPLTGRRVRWSSSDARIVVATSEGRVQSVQPGSAILTASCEGVSESLRVSVADEGPPAAGAGSETRRIKLRRVRSYQRERVIGVAAGGALVVGILWFVGRPRPLSAPPEQMPSVSAAMWVPTAHTPALPETTRALPAPVRPTPVGGRAGGRAGRPVPKSTIASTVVGSGSDTVAMIDSLGQETASLDTAQPARIDGAVEGGTRTAAGAPPTAAPVLPAPVTPPVPAAVDPLHERQQLEVRMLAGAERCYAALKSKDIDRVKDLYHASTPVDHDNLKRLGRLFRTREWSAEVGERIDGARQLGLDAAALEFSVRLTWKDAFGGHLSSHPVFRAEYLRSGGRWDLASCRMVGSPKL